MRLLGIGTLQSFSVPTNPEDSFHDVSVVGTSRITEKWNAAEYNLVAKFPLKKMDHEANF